MAERKDLEAQKKTATQNRSLATEFSKSEKLNGEKTALAPEREECRS